MVQESSQKIRTFRSQGKWDGAANSTFYPLKLVCIMRGLAKKHTAIDTTCQELHPFLSKTLLIFGIFVYTMLKSQISKPFYCKNILYFLVWPIIITKTTMFKFWLLLMRRRSNCSCAEGQNGIRITIVMVIGKWVDQHDVDVARSLI